MRATIRFCVNNWMDFKMLLTDIDSIWWYLYYTVIFLNFTMCSELGYLLGL